MNYRDYFAFNSWLSNKFTSQQKISVATQIIIHNSPIWRASHSDVINIDLAAIGVFHVILLYFILPFSFASKCFFFGGWLDYQLLEYRRTQKNDNDEKLKSTNITNNKIISWITCKTYNSQYRILVGTFTLSHILSLSLSLLPLSLTSLSLSLTHSLTHPLRYVSISFVFPVSFSPLIFCFVFQFLLQIFPFRFIHTFSSWTFFISPLLCQHTFFHPENVVCLIKLSNRNHLYVVEKRSTVLLLVAK